MIQDIYPHRLKNTYDPERKPDKDSLIILFSDKGLLIKAEESTEGSRKILPRLL